VAFFVEDNNTDVQNVDDLAQRGQFLGHVGYFEAKAAVAVAGRETRTYRKPAGCNAHSARSCSR
jgi:hypothetical protein